MKLIKFTIYTKNNHINENILKKVIISENLNHKNKINENKNNLP